MSRAPALDLLFEQRQDVLRRLVRNRERLDAELLLGLERLQARRGLFHIRIDQGADPCFHRIGEIADEIGLSLNPALCGTEGGRCRGCRLDQIFDCAQ